MDSKPLIAAMLINIGCTSQSSYSHDELPIAASRDSESRDWYVSPTGAPTNDGTWESPWSLSYAASCAGGQILPGDRVILAAGRYHGSVTITCSGTEHAPITYESDQGGAVLDGALQELSAPNAWEPVETRPGHNVYRSTTLYNTPQFPGNYHFTGFVLVGGQWMTLVVHGHNNVNGGDALDYLSSDEHEHLDDDPYYVGPGLAYSVLEGRLYIRLDNSTAQAQRGRATAQIMDPDPSDNDIRIMPWTSVGLRINASHVVVKGLTIENFTQGINTASPSAHHIVLSNLDVYPGYFGARLGFGSYITVENSRFYARMPASTFWAASSDIKMGDKAADNTRKVGLDIGAAHHVDIIDNEFHEFYDGLLSQNSAHHIRVLHNRFVQTWDDSWQLSYGSHHVEVAYNWFLGAGVSRDGSGSGASIAPNQGTVWIHHNVFAPHERQIWWYRGGIALPGDVDADGMVDGIPLSSHGSPSGSDYSFPWKLYYNTFYVREPKDHAVGIGAIGHVGNLATNYDGSPHEVYNNVFIDESGLTPGPSYFVSGRMDNGNIVGTEMYDGNVYSGWSARPIYRYVRTVNYGDIGNVMTPESLRANAQILAETQSYPIPSFQSTRQEGWEKQGFTFAGLTLDACYRPASCMVSPDPAKDCSQGAVSLVGSGWPGTEVYQPWRGAISPSGCALGE